MGLSRNRLLFKPFAFRDSLHPGSSTLPNFSKPGRAVLTRSPSVSISGSRPRASHPQLVRAAGSSSLRLSYEVGPCQRVVSKNLAWRYQESFASALIEPDRGPDRRNTRSRSKAAAAGCFLSRTRSARDHASLSDLRHTARTSGVFVAQLSNH